MPRYIDNLSSYARYRYNLLLILYVVSLYFPYLKEEIRRILYCWNENIFSYYWCLLINFLTSSRRNRVIYFTVHFIIFYLFSLIQAILFANVVFFHGDLRDNLYLLPYPLFYGVCVSLSITLILILKVLEHIIVIFYMYRQSHPRRKKVP